MYLIDTSVLIDFLCNRHTPAVQRFMMILDQGLPFGLTSIIYQEVLQGARSEKDFNNLVEYLSSQHFYLPQEPQQSYQAAAAIYRACRIKGITIRSTIDCLIAQIAIEHDLILLHNDEDYVRMAAIFPALRQIKE